MTDQEIFDTVIRALRKQGEPSYDPTGAIVSSRCRYRAKKPDGTVLKCAAGHMIPDEVYHPGMETKSVMFLQDVNGEAVEVPGKFGLLRDLQNAHDKAAETAAYTSGIPREECNAKWVSLFLAEASKLAVRDGLDDSVITENL